jgi:adenylate kinase
VKGVIFIAPPAAGKGTLSKYLVTHHGFRHISIGNLFRKRANQKDEEGLVLTKALKTGKLIDDERLFKLLIEELQTIKKGEKIILDGIPRTLQQAQKLDIILRDLNVSDFVVIHIKIDKEILKLRMTGRRICPKCQSTFNIYSEKFKPHKENTCDSCTSSLIKREDDTEDSFKVRYEIYKKNSEPIIHYYKNQHRLYEIDLTNEDQTDTLKELDRIVGAFVD